MNKPKDDIARKTIYEFKKFARKERFWEEYKELSRPINIRHISFIDVVNTYEPMRLIQSSEAFCMWPTLHPRKSNTFKSWLDLSKEWLKICEKKSLFRDQTAFLRYYNSIINY